MMREFRRFLIHELNHTVLLVDITSIGIPREGFPPEGKSQDVSSLRFQTWKDAEQFLLGVGASSELVENTKRSIGKVGVAVVTIPGALA